MTEFETITIVLKSLKLDMRKLKKSHTSVLMSAGLYLETDLLLEKLAHFLGLCKRLGPLWVL